MTRPETTDAAASWTITGRPDLPPLVLIHGLGGSSRAWDRLVPLVADRRRIVLVDLLGFGTAAAHGDRTRTIEGHARAVRSALRSAGIDEPATVVGHSMGGLVATAVATQAPDSVDALVLVNTPPTVQSRLTARAPVERLLRVPVAGRALWSAMGPAQARAGLASAFAPGVEVPDSWVEDLQACSLDAFAGGTAGIDRHLEDAPLASRLAALDVPTTVVFGMQDARVDAASLRGYAPIERIAVVEVPEAGHSPIWETPEPVAKAILAAPDRPSTAPSPVPLSTTRRPRSPGWSLRGKVVLITGASGGIGAATARALADRGATVALADLHHDALQGLAAEIGGGASSHPLDVTDRTACGAAVDDVVQTHGRLDVVWANAGVSAYGPLDLVDPSIWTRVVEVNLLGAFNTVQAALPHVIAAQGYVAVTCSLASFAHQPGHSAYSASKAGLEAMANSLRSELFGTGVDVGTIHPGWIATPMVTEKDEHHLAFQRFRKALKPPFDASVPVSALVPHIVGAFERRAQRVVFPRVGWLAHAVRPALNIHFLTAGVRSAAPEIRALFERQVAEEGAGAAMSARYRSPADDREAAP